MNIGGLVGFIAIGLACIAAAVRSRDSFYAGMAIAVVAFAGIQVARFGLDTTNFVASADELLTLVGALLLAAAVTLRRGLPTPIEDRLLHGPAFRDRAFDRRLTEARRPFVDAARAGHQSMYAKARWRPLLTALPPSPSWASLADRVAQGDEAWAVQARSGVDHYWVPWGARNDEIGADWGNLRAALEAQRSKREPIVRRVSWLVAAASTVCLVAGPLGVPTGIQSLPPEGRAAIVPEHVRPRPAVHLAPLGDVPVAELESLAAFYAERYDLPVGVLPPAPIAVVPRDGTRNQLASEDLIELLQASYPHGQFPNQILIGVVSADMYSRGIPEWRFVFGTWTEGNRAVISTARMTARWGPFGDLLERARMRKMVTRYIGFMYFGLPESADPHSVLHVPLLSRDDLDTMGEDY